MSYKSYIDCGVRNAECLTQEVRDVECGPHPAFRTRHFGLPIRSLALQHSITPTLHHSTAAFTMVEIAISLAVIGFALVAIIGILPTGMNVQKENREETIIGQDALLLMDAIRSGAKGMDDLTNYVDAITNYQTEFFQGVPSRTAIFGYTATNSSALPANGYTFPLTNGFRIIGLLSMPKYLPITNPPPPNVPSSFWSNYIVAYVHSMSGPASEKFPQNNPTVRDFAFSYRLTSDMVPYASYDPDWTNYSAYLSPPLNPPDTNAWQRRSNYWMTAKALQNNLYDLRLTFRWPLLPNGNMGNGRQIFRTLASGNPQLVGDPSKPGDGKIPNGTNLYFFQSRNYVNAP